ncbi:MAG: CARDB domain-containing protein, partial [Thermoplasmata archaeon]
SIEFSAAAYDEFANLITDDAADFTWSGADASGMFLETVVGTYDVTAAYNGVTSTAVTVTVVPGAAHEVEISPDTDQTVESGESIEFSAAAYDEFANLITDDAADFTWSGADASGMFLETVVGTYDVTAAYGGVTSTAVTVTVIPGDAHTVEISPDTEQTVEAGETLDFSAAAYDEFGNLITDDAADFTWSGAANGVFYEETVGTYDVTAAYDGVTSTTVTVTVVPGAAHEVEISPDTDQTVESGESIEFSAAAYDEFANLITDDVADFTWANADAGVFQETEAGTYDVTAAYDGVTSTAVTVTVELPLDNPYFEVEITDYDEEVEEGEQVPVEYTVTNTGDLEGTQDIVFSVNDMEIEVHTDIILGADQEHTGTFTWTAEDEGEYTLEVSSDNESSSATMTVTGETEEPDESEDSEEPGFLEDYWWILILLIIILMIVVVLAMRHGKEEPVEDIEDDYSDETEEDTLSPDEGEEEEESLPNLNIEDMDI